jgi:iron(II)-dependent oxidoreductase
MPTAPVIDWARDARRRTFELVADLDDDQLMGPRLATVNPLLWEIGHVAWFQEKWVLRRRPDYAPVRADADALYDSSAVAHDTRWQLPLPDRRETLRYLTEVSDRVAEHLGHGQARQEDIYFALLTVFHEDMHTEAFTYTRQTLGYRAPRFSQDGRETLATECLQRTESCGGAPRGDVAIPGGVFELGASAAEPFVFDNEKWAHRVALQPFAIARAPVTQAEFAAFVDDGGYGQTRFWSEAGRDWLTGTQARQPVY